jgi:hypothetical protein
MKTLVLPNESRRRLWRIASLAGSNASSARPAYDPATDFVFDKAVSWLDRSGRMPALRTLFRTATKVDGNLSNLSC